MLCGVQCLPHDACLWFADGKGEGQRGAEEGVRGCCTNRSPKKALSHAMPLARGARELEGGMHHIGLEAHSVCHALHKEGVPTAECGHRQNAHLELHRQRVAHVVLQ